MVRAGSVLYGGQGQWPTKSLAAFLHLSVCIGMSTPCFPYPGAVSKLFLTDVLVREPAAFGFLPAGWQGGKVSPHHHGHRVCPLRSVVLQVFLCREGPGALSWSLTPNRDSHFTFFHQYLGWFQTGDRAVEIQIRWCAMDVLNESLNSCRSSLSCLISH